MQQYERQADQTSRQSHAILDLPCMADMVQEMMLPRYHLKDSDESWSRDALDFLTCCLSGSIRSLVAVMMSCTCRGKQLTPYSTCFSRRLSLRADSSPASDSPRTSLDKSLRAGLIARKRDCDSASHCAARLIKIMPTILYYSLRIS